MPRGKGQGGARRRRRGDLGTRELLIKEDGEEYAQVLKLLGNGRMEVHCMDDEKRIAKVRGKFMKRIWVRVSDIVLVCLRELDEDKCDIIHVYLPHEAKQLKQMGEIPSKIEINEAQNQLNAQLDIEFESEVKNPAEEKNKVKTEKQNLNDFMPGSDSDDNDEAPAKPAPKKQAPEPPKQIQGTTREVHKPDSGSDEEDEDDAEEGSSERSDKEFDPLADI